MHAELRLRNTAKTYLQIVWEYYQGLELLLHLLIIRWKKEGKFSSTMAMRKLVKTQKVEVKEHLSTKFNHLLIYKVMKLKKSECHVLLLSKKTQRTQCIISLKVYIYIFYYLLRISRTYSTQLWQICITLTKIMQKNERREREWYHSFWNQKETEAEIWSWHCHECLINKKSETQKKKK